MNQLCEMNKQMGRLLFHQQQQTKDNQQLQTGLTPVTPHQDANHPEQQLQLGENKSGVSNPGSSVTQTPHSESLGGGQR